MKPIIGITLGDVSGIGPEVILKALQNKIIRRKCHPLLIGSADILEHECSFSPAYSGDIKRINSLSKAKFTSQIINVFDFPGIKLSTLVKGKVSAKAAKASMSFIKKAVELALEKKIDAITTAPISKEGIHKAGFKFQGHTDYLAYLTKSKKYGMMFIYKNIRVLLVTIHVSLKSVSRLITQENILEKIFLAQEACKLLGVSHPKIAVCGLNPHAGESGSFGKEELEVIEPAVKKAKKNGLNVVGPLPPDTVFYRGITQKEFDLIICMYHDQGLIPFKMLAFDKGVNATIGLPIIRTSPDHGTAYNIAKQRIANPDSMIEAILLAASMAKSKKNSSLNH